MQYMMSVIVDDEKMVGRNLRDMTYPQITQCLQADRRQIIQRVAIDYWAL